MILTEYDEQKHIKNEKEISWEEGRMEGEVTKLIYQICSLLRNKKDISILTSVLGETPELVNRLTLLAEPFAPDYDVASVIAAWKTSQ